MSLLSKKLSWFHTPILLGIHSFFVIKALLIVKKILVFDYMTIPRMTARFSQVMKTAMLSKTSDRLVMVNNAVGNFRHNAHMAPFSNNGNARMDESGDFAPDAEEIQTVLLSDVINKAVEVEQPKNIIMKIDIESYECRAFMGSPEGNTGSF